MHAQKAQKKIALAHTKSLDGRRFLKLCHDLEQNYILKSKSRKYN